MQVQLKVTVEAIRSHYDDDECLIQFNEHDLARAVQAAITAKYADPLRITAGICSASVEVEHVFG